MPVVQGPLAFWEELKDSELGVYPDQVAYGRCESWGSLGQLQPLALEEPRRAYPKAIQIATG